MSENSNSKQVCLKHLLVSRDAYPQWRKLVWSPDCSFVVLAYGNGVVSFFDLTASNLFNIPIVSVFNIFYCFFFSLELYTVSLVWLLIWVWSHPFSHHTHSMNLYCFFLYNIEPLLA